MNRETGESLSDEMPGVSSVVQIDQEHVVMHSDEYVILDSKAMAYIAEHFSPTDLGRIMQMTDMTYGDYNILYNGPTPHSRESLMDTLTYSRNKFANFMKRLEKKSIIYYITGYKDEKRVTYIMLNPHLARKRKTMHKECLNSFPDIRVKLLDDGKGS